MATGVGAAHGGSLESTLARKFQSVSNTMDSIQGLSTWCIDNKKYHSVIVRNWMKCLRKSDAPHRLNLFYLANDVIQNCKRKNAIVYRTEFAEVLPEAFVLVNQERDSKVIKSVERILTIWEERGVYTGTLITELRGSLIKEESPPETPVEQKTPVESTAELRSKVVNEFVPQALIDQLAKYKRSLEEVDLREKQLAAMRVDICSSGALKKLKDKAGGKRFSKDFEEANTQLQEFVKFLEKESKVGPPVMEALGNADIFYEMQYKEVKIVANAYQTFANRVSHLKRKLDALKATLPDLDESPIPSPSADAPSPTGSESPFHGMEMDNPSPDIDGTAMDDEVEPPAPSPLSSVGASPTRSDAVGENDNRQVEDMELSDEEMDSTGIIVEQQMELPSRPEVSTPVNTATTEASVVTEQPIAQVTPPVAAPAASAPAASARAASAPATSAPATSAPAASAPATAVESVDLGKIGSILNSLSAVIKNTGSKVESPPAASPAARPALSVASQDNSSLVNLISKVDASPSELLGALSEVQGQSGFGGLSSTTRQLNKPALNVSSASSSTGKVPSLSTSASAVPPQSPSLSSVAPVPSPHSPAVEQSTTTQAPPQTPNQASALVQALHRNMELAAESDPSSSSKSLESKIHSFLQGNPAFNAFDLSFSVNSVGMENLNPVTGTDNQGGTPVRDEGGGTPTQDEIMDKPVVVPFTSNSNTRETVDKAPVGYQNNSQMNIMGSQQQAQNGQAYQHHPRGKQEMPERGISTPVGHYQQFSTLTGGLVPAERAPGTQADDGFQGLNEMSWYSDTYPEGSSQQPRGYNVTIPAGPSESKSSGLYQFQTELTREPQEAVSQQGSGISSGFFSSMKNLPPVPKLPPPPRAFDAPPVTSNPMIPPDQQAFNRAGEVTGARTESVIGGMVVHDHQHKSMYHSGDVLFKHGPPRPPHHPEDLHPQRNDLQYRDEVYGRDSLHFQEDPYRHPEDPYYRPGSPPHQYLRGQGITPPLSPAEDPYYSHDYQHHSTPPPQFIPRRPLPPRLEPHHPGMRPPHMHPHPGHHLHPRGPPHAPFPPRFHGPNPALRGKRPGPRGGAPGPMFPPKRPFPRPRY